MHGGDLRFPGGLRKGGPTAAVPTSAEASERPVIVLDAGHGGLDSGAVGKSGVLEKDVNLSVVKHLQQLLELSGFRTVLTRDEDISIYDPGVEGIRNQKLSDMDNRLEIIQSYPDSIFLCIHQNNYTDRSTSAGRCSTITTIQTTGRWRR